MVSAPALIRRCWSLRVLEYYWAWIRIYHNALQTPRREAPRRPPVIGNAVKVMRIATGEEEEELPDSVKSAAAELGSRGGKARATQMTPERRTEIARKAAAKRWSE
jgi:hypothetical protein